MAIKKLVKKRRPETEPATSSIVTEAVADTDKLRFKERLLNFLKTKKGKLVTLLLGVGLLLTLLFAIPVTRYAVAGLVIRKDVTIVLQDTKTSRPVSGATISIGSYNAQTDGKGEAILAGVPVGQYELIVTKQLYNQISARVTVPILSEATLGTFSIEAIGRQVPIVVTNKITNAPIANVKLVAGESNALTDDKGQATIIAPADAQSIKVLVEADSYNRVEVELVVAEQPENQNKLELTPAGKIYFLSKRTGKINVMKSDLDGSNPQVVVQGTGRELDGETQLVASRDWRYLTLKAKRESDKAKLYLIKTENDNLQVIDEGDADFSLVGWADHHLIYKINRLNIAPNYPDKLAIKSYNAETGQLKEIDKVGLNQTYYYGPVLIDNEVFVSKTADGTAAAVTAVYSVMSDGSNLRAVTVEGHGDSYAFSLYKPRELYIYNQRSNGKQYEYKNGKLAEVKVDSEQFYKSYPTYFYSPSNQRTFRTDNRDGKSVALLGDKEGDNEKIIASLDEKYRQYGWYTDDYLLLSKSNKELYILSISGGEPLKVTDYHRPYDYLDYGGGYGGY